MPAKPVVVSNISGYLRHNHMATLLVCVPLALCAGWFTWGASWVFVLSAIGVIPLASLIGESTETLAAKSGPRMEVIECYIGQRSRVDHYDNGDTRWINGSG